MSNSFVSIQPAELKALAKAAIEKAESWKKNVGRYNFVVTQQIDANQLKTKTAKCLLLLAEIAETNNTLVSVTGFDLLALKE